MDIKFKEIRKPIKCKNAFALPVDVYATVRYGSLVIFETLSEDKSQTIQHIGRVLAQDEGSNRLIILTLGTEWRHAYLMYADPEEIREVIDINTEFPSWFFSSDWDTRIAGESSKINPDKIHKCVVYGVVCNRHFEDLPKIYASQINKEE